MRSRNRLVLGLTSPLALVGALAVVELLPASRSCPSIECGDFNIGAVNVFGSGNLTLLQTVILAAGIWAAAWLLPWSLLPTKVLTSAGIATVVLALAVAWLLPAQVFGPEPSVACTTPGDRGQPIEGRCATGPAPVDNRVGDRVLVLAAGLTVLGLAAIGDRRRSRLGGPLSTREGSLSSP